MIEQVIDKLVEIIADHASTELVKQNGVFSDGIELPEIASVVLGDDTPATTGLPAIVLKPTSTTQRGYLSPAKKDVNHAIDIGVAITSTDDDEGFRRLWRTMRAIECVLEIHAPGNGPIINLEVQSMDYKAGHFGINDSRSTEKAGTISVIVLERLDAYTSTQT